MGKTGHNVHAHRGGTIAIVVPRLTDLYPADPVEIGDQWFVPVFADLTALVSP